MKNALNWFEIPVVDFNRAKAFYAQLLNAPIIESPNPYLQYGFLPHDQQTGVGGAIVAGKDYVPSVTGTVVYLNGGNDLQETLNRVEVAGGKVILPKTEIGGGMGYLALFFDTEGNKVGLHSMG